MESLIPYLPTDRRHALARGEQLPDRARGAALFVDISGFTPIAEALTRDLGPQRGAEQLTRYLNQVYDVLVADLDRFGGSAIGFSGDAITCWFEADSGLIAVGCALAMQESMAQFAAVRLPSGEQLSLAAKAGVATGQVRRFVVGDPGRQLIDVLAGQLLDEMAEAEHRAAPGEVVLGPTATEMIGESVNIHPWDDASPSGGRFGVAQALRTRPRSNPWPELPATALSEEQLRPWLLGPVFERLRAGHGEFLAELRPAVALFLRFEGIDYDADEAAGDKLDEFVRHAQRVIGEYDGTLVDITTGDKGSHFYIAFGAPTAHEDDLERAASAALDLRSDSASLTYLTDLRIGISHGRMRTGAYGGSTRRTYGVLGDATNLAARLMQAAQPGEILVSYSSREGIRRAFSWHEQRLIQVKGKADPIRVVSLVGRQAEGGVPRTTGRHTLPMVGREPELALLRQKLAQVSAGHGQIVGITGEAGMGKSRLLTEAVRFALQNHFSVFSGECKSYGTHSAYMVWGSIWRGLLAIDPSHPNQHQIASLVSQVGRLNPALLPRLPLLGPLLNLPIPDNELTRPFDAKLRKTSLESLLVDLLRARAGEGSLLLVLEDTHWIDPLSSDLLEVFGRGLGRQRILVLLAYRSAAAGAGDTARLKKVPDFTEILLSDLTPDKAERWVMIKLRRLYDTELRPPRSFVDRLIGRAEGNPFYIEEVLNYLKDHSISPQDAEALDQIELPTSLHSLVLTRIDQLQELPRSTLRVASVLGRRFKASEIEGAYPQLGAQHSIQTVLNELGRKGFTELESGPDPSYLFKHSVIQEVAYESLPFDTRGALHEAIGLFFERVYADELDRQLDLLAFHYDRSPNELKRRQYLLRAGEAAQANYANSAAIDYFRKVLPLLSTGQQIDTLLRLGQVYELLGEWTEANQAYRRSLDLAQSAAELDAQARGQTAIGELFRKQGEYADASSWLQQARTSFQELGDQAGVARVLHFSGTLAAQQGDYEAAGNLYEQSLAIRQQLEDKLGIASLLSNLGIVARFRGNFAHAQELNEQSLAIRRSVGDRWAIANSLNNQGTVYLDQGKHHEARGKLEEAVALLREVGDRWHYANAVNNLANVSRGLGEYSAARSLYYESLAINRELGDGWALAYLLEDIGYLNAAEGHSEQALKLVGAAESLRVSIGAPLPPAEQEALEKSLQPARQALSQEAQQAALSAGREMTLEQALDFTLVGP